MKAISRARGLPSPAKLLLTIAAVVALQNPLAAKADDLADGKAAFAACSGCHSVTGGGGLGPHLDGVVGRKAGAVGGFNYSPAMKRSNIVWDAATLEKYMQNPQSAVPGNRMPFAGLQDEQKRDEIAVYLASLK
jgi:cytochrome c